VVCLLSVSYFVGIRWNVEKATGELIDTETVTISSEGAVIRSPETWSDPRGWEPKVP
jgi:hypothetical protein